MGRFKVAAEDMRKLAQAIEEYGNWVKSDEYAPKYANYSQTLMDFLVFAINNEMAFKDMFTVDTLEAFRKHSRFKSAPHALVSLSDYLFSESRIDQPLKISSPQVFKQVVQLPDLHEQYL